MVWTISRWLVDSKVITTAVATSNSSTASHENGYVENEDSLERTTRTSTRQTSFFEIHAARISSKWTGARARGLLPDGEPQAIFGIGAWESLPYGAVFTIYSSNHCKYVFHANLHLNPFGKKPKLLQGVVVREETSAYPDAETDQPYLRRRRIPWFRPVVATFEALGTGEDMADFSYQNRGMGLTQYVDPE
jgi:hypothetical protein